MWRQWAIAHCPQTAAWFQHKSWLGVTAENQRRADERIPVLLQTPAAVRWVSLEPLLGPIDLNKRELLIDKRRFKYTLGNYLDWVVVGCESGPKRRPCKIEWVREIVEQCRDAGVPVFVKQLSINGKVSHDMDEWPEDLRVREYPVADSGGGVLI